jgi:aldose 1-epimerase
VGRARPSGIIAGMNPCTVELRAGSLRLALRADLGGAIAGLWHGATPVLRSVEPAALSTARASGCFPLVPYSNRIGSRRFHWQGQDHHLAANFDDSPHALHGVAWQRPWTVASCSPTQADLRYRHIPDADWPFAFDVSQRFELAPAGLTAHLAITNQAARPQPVGLGWHPNFPKRANARLDIEVNERWNCDASQLPTQPVAHPGIHAAVTDLALDHCFGGWQAPALIRDDALALRLSSSLPRLVVYTPPSLAFYAVEPVSHVNNAIQMADPAAHGLRTLAPGATFEAWMQLDVLPLETPEI